MPLEFAHKLFGVTHLGVAVILADNASEPTDVVHPGLLLPRHADDEARVVVAKATEKALPPLHRHEAPHRPAQVLASVAERKLTILEDGHTRLSGPLTVKNPRQPVGNHMFILNEAHESGTALKWTAISYRMTPSRRAGRPAPSEASVIDRLTTDRRTADTLHSVMHPGLVMVVTDAPASPRTRSSQGFVIATHHEPDGWRASTTQIR
jgi:hypothetical protein